MVSIAVVKVNSMYRIEKLIAARTNSWLFWKVFGVNSAHRLSSSCVRNTSLISIMIHKSTFKILMNSRNVNNHHDGERRMKEDIDKSQQARVSAT